MIKPLIWKEWHEQRWKLAFGTVMLVFFTGALVAAGLTSDREIVVLVWGFGGLILSLYSAMGVFAPEITEGTKIFLTSKPIAFWKVFACKWFFGWLNFVVPMLASALCLQFTFLRGLENPLIEALFGSIGLATMFYTMTCCLAPRKSSEAFVGFVGLLVFFLLMTHILVVESFRVGNYRLEPLFFINPLYCLHLTFGRSRDQYILAFCLVQIVIIAMVLFIGFRKWKRSV